MDSFSFHLSVDFVLRIPDPAGDLGLILWLGGTWLWRRLRSSGSTSRFTLETSRLNLKWKRTSKPRCLKSASTAQTPQRHRHMSGAPSPTRANPADDEHPPSLARSRGPGVDPPKPLLSPDPSRHPGMSQWAPHG